MFTKGQSGELAWLTSSNIPSPLKWFLGPFSDFASSLLWNICEKEALVNLTSSLRCTEYLIELRSHLSLTMQKYASQGEK